MGTLLSAAPPARRSRSSRLREGPSSEPPLGPVPAGSCGSSGGSPERVYQWIPTTSGAATFATCGAGTSYDTVLYVRSGACTNGTQVACNDDACATSTGSNLASRVTANVTAGQSYFVIVDGYGGRSGNYALTITPPTVCGNNRREGAEVCDGTDVSACVTGQCAANCQCVQPSQGLPISSSSRML